MFFLQKKKKKKLVFFFKNHENELRIQNTYQNGMKPKYVSNGILKRHWFTSDDFLRYFRSPDENFSKFQKIFIRPSKIFQKVIRSEPEVRLISVNNIFRFHNILMVIYWHKFIFVTHAMQNRFFFLLEFFFFKKKKSSDFRASFSALFSKFLQDLGIEEHLHAQESKIHM